jgi:hypothetical protein
MLFIPIRYLTEVHSAGTALAVVRLTTSSNLIGCSIITLLSCVAVGRPLAAGAQEPDRVRRLGVMVSGPSKADAEGQARVAALKLGLLETVVACFTRGTAVPYATCAPVQAMSHLTPTSDISARGMTIRQEDTLRAVQSCVCASTMSIARAHSARGNQTTTEALAEF